MTIKEEIAAAKAQLAALKERIEANDAEAITEGEKLAQTIEAKTAELQAAEKKTNILKALGSTDTDRKDNTMAEKNTNTLADQLTALNLVELKANRGGRSIMLPRKAATDTVVGTQVPTLSQLIPEAPEAIRVRDVFTPEQISGNALTYFVMGATESAAAVTAEGGQKPQVHPTYEKKTVALSKVAAFLKETDEILEDLPYLESVIRGRGTKAVRDVIDSTLVTGLLGTSGIQTVTTGISFDNLLKAKMAIAAATGFTPNAIIINPADLQTLLLTKDSNNQYLMGGPAYSPYGAGNYSPYLPIWGMQVISSAAITSGTAIVGACQDGASVVTKQGEGMRVEVTNSNEDDFEHNIVTVRMEERILLAVRVPAAFCKVYTAG